MKFKVVDARAEAEEVRVKADKKVAIYLKDAAEARMKLKGDSDRERRSREAKSLQALRDVAKKEHADLVEQVRQLFEVSDNDSDTVTNGPNPQVQQKLDQIKHLRVEADAVKAEAEEWKSNMDRLASEKETAWASLASTKFHLRDLKEKALVQAKKIEELQSQQNSAISDRENLAKELETAKPKAKVVKIDANEMVAYKANAEAAQVRAKDIIEYAKRQSRREALEEIHARDFDLSAEIESAKDDEDFKDLGESEGGGDPEDDKVAPGEDQAT
ncbi:uncharacterized protein [Nicotiana sylvestris]|uniref:uncharacterized protein n=1 Tax=Nicotiana sylvestris TaxID=4096 RepID=UPI00388CBF7B